VTTLFFVIVLFMATEGPTPYQASVLTGNFDSYESCLQVLAAYPGVLPGVLRPSFAGAACVESDLAARLTVGAVP
jgi:hypothetical protein